MDEKSTPLVSYRNINVDEIDLYEDAFGLNIEFLDVKELLGQLVAEPGECLISDLMQKVRDLN